MSTFFSGSPPSNNKPSATVSVTDDIYSVVKDTEQLLSSLVRTMDGLLAIKSVEANNSAKKANLEGISKAVANELPKVTNLLEEATEYTLKTR